MNIDYALAKEMRDAGFPQGGTMLENKFVYLDENANPCGPMGRGAVYIPALEEVIEECAKKSLDGFVGVSRLSSTEANAWGKHADPDDNTHHSGATPLEAVCRLYIALNKKI